MKHTCSAARSSGRRYLWLLGCLLGLVGGGAAHAQAWQRAFTVGAGPLGFNDYSYVQCLATDASGNILVTGGFAGSVVFGSTRLTSIGASNIFLAKWSPTTNAWVWAIRDGGAGNDYPSGIAVSGNRIYLTGGLYSTSTTTIAGTVLAGSSTQDVFVAKYLDQGTTATGQWAMQGGGTGLDDAAGIAVSGTSVYITGSYPSGTGFSVAGTTLPGTGDEEMYLAKYTDNGSSATAGWAVSGGGSGYEEAYGVAASGTAVYVSGGFSSGAGASFAGTALAGAGGTDMYLAKYVDLGSSAGPGWAVSGGGASSDYSRGLAVIGTRIYVTGSFVSNYPASFGGIALAGAGGTDMFLACYLDAGSTATSRWALSGGGTGSDAGVGVAASGGNIYVSGRFSPGGSVQVAGTTLTSAGRQDHFLARYSDTGTAGVGEWASSGGGTGDDICRTVAVSGRAVFVGGNVAPPATFGSYIVSVNSVQPLSLFAQAYDAAVLQPLAAAAPAGAAASLHLWPNPTNASSLTTLSGTAPGAAVQVLDALGRLVLTTPADAAGRATLRLPESLPGGVYVVRSGAAATRLIVE